MKKLKIYTTINILYYVIYTKPACSRQGKFPRDDSILDQFLGSIISVYVTDQSCSIGEISIAVFEKSC
jgi:hypothetical protein